MAWNVNSLRIPHMFLCSSRAKSTNRYKRGIKYVFLYRHKKWINKNINELLRQWCWLGFTSWNLFAWNFLLTLLEITGLMYVLRSQRAVIFRMFRAGFYLFWGLLCRLTSKLGNLYMCLWYLIEWKLKIEWIRAC